MQLASSTCEQLEHVRQEVATHIRKTCCAVADAFHACADAAGLLRLFGKIIRLRFLAPNSEEFGEGLANFNKSTTTTVDC